MKQHKIILRLSIILITSICYSSCSWGVLIVIGNSLDQDIEITYKVDESNFSKNPPSFSFDKNIFSFYKKVKPIELPNNATYNDELKTVSLTIKSGEASLIGKYYSFDSFKEKLINSELKVMIDKHTILEKEELMEFSKYKKKINVLEIK